MRYLGGKSRIAGKIAAALLPYLSKVDTYAEPCLGGGSSAVAVAKIIDKPMVLGDMHEDLILLYRALQDGWTPPAEVSEDMYRGMKSAPPSALRGFVGFGCSFGGKWFGGYARGTKRNYARESRDNLLRTITHLKRATFVQTDLYNFPPEGYGRMLFYFDVPYQGTTTYKDTEPFDHEGFFRHCRRLATQGHIVTVSEYVAPEDFKPIWEQEHRVSIRDSAGQSASRTERLFLLGD